VHWDQLDCRVTFKINVIDFFSQTSMAWNKMLSDFVNEYCNCYFVSTHLKVNILFLQIITFNEIKVWQNFLYFIENNYVS